MEEKRPIVDEYLLYDYAILDDGICPVLVVRDLMATPELGRNANYWEAKYSLMTIIRNIGQTMHRELTGMAALLRDTDGRYLGIDLLGDMDGYDPYFELTADGMPIMCETQALEVIRKRHPERVGALSRIQSALSHGGNYIFCKVLIYNGRASTTFYVGDCITMEELKAHKEYIHFKNMFCSKNQCCFATVTIRRIGQIQPTPDSLMEDLKSFGLEEIRLQSFCNLEDEQTFTIL